MKSTGFVPLKPSNLPKASSGGFVPKILQSGAALTEPAPSAPGSHAAHGQPAVQLRHEGDRVTGITVRCGCGQVIELECTY